MHVHVKDVFWHILTSILKNKFTPSRSSDTAKDATDPQGGTLSARQEASFFSVIGKLIALLSGTFFFAWLGNTRLICAFIAIILLVLLFWFSTLRSRFDASPEQIKPLVPALILGTIASFAKVIGDISVHFAAGAPPKLFDTAGFIHSLNTFHWKTESSIGVIFFVLALLVFKWRISGTVLGLLQNLLRSCGIFTFGCNAYILAAGWWGGEAIHAAMEVFHITLHDSLIRNDAILTDSFWNATHQDAFCLLYNIQGKFWFYTLVVMIPSVFLLVTLGNWVRRIPTKTDKTVLFSVYLLLIAFSVANRVGDIRQSPDTYVVDKKFTASHLDATLASCLNSHTGDGKTGCYAGAAAGWDQQRQSMVSIINTRLSKRGKRQYQEENREWDDREINYFDSLSHAVANRQDASFVLAREHWRIIRDRVLIQHREAVWKGILSQ